MGFSDSAPDGALTEADHVTMGHRAADTLGYRRDSGEAAAMVAAYVAVWRDLHAPHVDTASDTTDDQTRSRIRIGSYGDGENG